MKLSCSVIRDLLPLYAEGLVSGESAALVEEHLKECEECAKFLEELRQPPAPVPENPAPIRGLKKEISRRRWRTAAAVALCVFIALFAFLAFVTDKKPVGYSENLLTVVGPAKSAEGEGDELLILRDPRVSGIQSELAEDDETGEKTLYLQYYVDRPLFGNERLLPVPDADGIAGGYILLPAAREGSSPARENEKDAIVVFASSLEDRISPVPDRVIYGFGNEQVLLWGKPMNGGVQVLPRLVLGYYVLIAAALSLVLAVLWIILRGKGASAVILQILFAPLSYVLGHLCVKGIGTLSFFLEKDFLMILAEAAAFYVLLTLCRLAFRDRRREAAQIP